MGRVAKAVQFATALQRAFADRGEFNAKGISEPVRVSEVRWRE